MAQYAPEMAQFAPDMELFPPDMGQFPPEMAPIDMPSYVYNNGAAYEVKYDADQDSGSDTTALNNASLIALRSEGHFCDVLVQIHDSGSSKIDFAAHKLILVAASPFFRYLYESGQLFNVVDLPNSFGAAAFSILLDAMYGRPLTMEDVRAQTTDVASLLPELQALATFLGLTQLAKQIENWTHGSSLNHVTVKEESNDDDEISYVTNTRYDAPEISAPKKKRVRKLIKDAKNGMKRSKGKGKMPKSEDAPVANGLGEEESAECTTKTELLSVEGNETPIENHQPSSSSLKRKSMKPMKDRSHSTDLEPINADILAEDAIKDDDNDNPDDEPSDPINAELHSQFKSLSQDEIKNIFPNPRDRVIIAKQRLKNKVDRVQGSMNSWHRACHRKESLIGKKIPYANRSARVNKIWNDDKLIAGEVRGESVDDELELKSASGEIQKGIVCQVAPNEVWCPFCDLKIARSSKSMLTAHMASHFLSDHDYVWVEHSFVCDLCDFVHFTLDNVKDHLHLFHNITRKGSGEAAILCPNCGITFATKKRLRLHKLSCAAGCEAKEREETKNKPKKVYPPRFHACDACGKSFPASVLLENHMSKDHGAPYRFYCSQPDCSYGVNTRSYLLEHLFSAHRIHAGTSPILKCEHCDYVTLSKNLHKKHNLSHTAVEYSLKCTYEGCDKSFRQKRHLKKHLDEFHGNLQLPCPYCSSTFASKIKLRRHEKVMHTQRVRNFKCPYCSHATVTKENCRTHVKRSHPLLPPDVIDLQKLGLPPMPL